jgi:hypothetical protein
VDAGTYPLYRLFPRTAEPVKHTMELVIPEPSGRRQEFDEVI